jgi:hypothetical protein
MVHARAANDMQATAALTALTARDLGDTTKLPLVFKWTSPFNGSDHDYLEVEYGHSGPEADNWFAG